MTGVFTHIPDRVFNTYTPTFLSEFEIYRIREYLCFLVFKKLPKCSIKMNSNWFLSTILAFTYYISVFESRYEERN